MLFLSGCLSYLLIQSSRMICVHLMKQSPATYCTLHSEVIHNYVFFCLHTIYVPQPFLPQYYWFCLPLAVSVFTTNFIWNHSHKASVISHLSCRIELKSHDLSPKPLLPIEEHRILCNHCSGIVTNNISKYNAIKASVTAPLWQVLYFPPQSKLNNNKTLLDNLYCQREAYNSEISRIRDVLDLLVMNRRHVNQYIHMYNSLSASIH